ncbi:hypothetical protein F2Q70_00018350 [Brassica cretica]|uniref:Uncharacterized protein n=1 Tax=Brassica cretica TaxID=69181 RepID=A0A8S9HP73_BRACR|nr:hypothetical protein F2Q70_00018350 [Brassica cretica]
MNWFRSWSKFRDSDRIVPSPSRSASGPWCWVGRSVTFLFDCWLVGRFGGVTLPTTLARGNELRHIQRIRDVQCKSLSHPGKHQEYWKQFDENQAVILSDQ